MFLLRFCVTTAFPCVLFCLLSYTRDVVLAIVRHVLAITRNVAGMFTSAVYSVDIHVDSSKCVQITRHLALGKWRVCLRSHDAMLQ